jgi:hypothetical protein
MMRGAVPNPIPRRPLWPSIALVRPVSSDNPWPVKILCLLAFCGLVHSAKANDQLRAWAFTSGEEMPEITVFDESAAALGSTMV